MRKRIIAMASMNLSERTINTPLLVNEDQVYPAPPRLRSEDRKKHSRNKHQPTEDRIAL